MELTDHECYRELLQAREMLREFYRHPVLLETAAEHIHLSPWHFQRAFRRAFHETPHAFVTRLRIERAQELLAHTSLSVLDVCLEVGYGSLGSFSTLFKRHVGLTPRQHRKQMRAVVAVDGLRHLTCIPYCFAKAFAPSSVSRTD